MLEHRVGGPEIILDYLGAARPIAPAEHAPIGSGINDPVDVRNSLEIDSVSHVRVRDADVEAPERQAVQSDAGSVEIIDAKNLQTRERLSQCAPVSAEAAESGD